MGSGRRSTVLLAPSLLSLAAGAGARAVGITVGTRYIHTVTEMIAKKDLQAALDILVAYLEEV